MSTHTQIRIHPGACPARPVAHMVTDSSLLAPALARKVDAIRSVPLFAGVADGHLRPLAESALLRTFAARQSIAAGQASHNCIILVSGRAKAVMPRGDGGHELTTEIFESPSVLSAHCWSARTARVPCEMVALEPGRVLFLSRRIFESFLLRHPSVALRLVQTLVAQLDAANERIAQISCLEVGDRLYQRLEEFCESRGTAMPGGAVRIEHGLHQAELAASIGATREAVNRQLSQWRALGLVESGRRVLTVKDPGGLSRAVSRHLRGRGSFAAVAGAERQVSASS